MLGPAHSELGLDWIASNEAISCSGRGACRAEGDGENLDRPISLVSKCRATVRRRIFVARASDDGGVRTSWAM